MALHGFIRYLPVLFPGIPPINNTCQFVISVFSYRHGQNSVRSRAQLSHSSDITPGHSTSFIISWMHSSTTSFFFAMPHLNDNIIYRLLSSARIPERKPVSVLSHTLVPRF